MSNTKYMDEYYVIRHLGRGSEGNVILAEHKRHGQQIAIKRTAWSDIEEANVRLNEANRLTLLKHPHIIELKSVFLQKYSKHNQFVCLCLEYCKGGDLSVLIQQQWGENGYMSEEDIIQYGIEICSGLEYLHTNHVIHRDLKPQNILIDGTGHLKISDFGFSTQVGKSFIATTQVGTPNYMSFEMLQGESYTEKTDMYSFGVILCEMMTGKSMMISMIMRNDARFIALKKQLHEQYSKNLVDLMFLLLSPDPSNRPSAKHSSRILKNILNIKRNDVIDANMVLNPTLEPMPEFMNFPEELKLRVFSYLDILDIYQVNLTCRSFHKLIESYWWIQYCTETKAGVKLMNKKPARRLQNPSDYKAHVRYTMKNKLKRGRRNMSLMGKTSVHEIYPSQLEETATLITLYIFRFSSLNYLQWLLNDNTFRKAKMEKYLEEKFPREQHRIHIGSIRSFDPSTLNSSSIFAGNSTMTVEDDEEEEIPPESKKNNLGINVESLPVDVQAVSVQISPTLSGDSPMISEVVLTKKEKVRQEKLFKKLKSFSFCILRFGIKYGRVLVGLKHGLKHEKHIHACSIWVNPFHSLKKYHNNLTLLKRIGFYKLLSTGWKWSELKRLRRFFYLSDTTRMSVLDTSNAWILYFVASDNLNRGFGTSVLTPIFKVADDQGMPILAYIYDNPTIELIRFFKRHGFDLFEKSVDGEKDTPAFWTTRRM